MARELRCADLVRAMAMRFWLEQAEAQMQELAS